jgi:exonuclease III
MAKAFSVASWNVEHFGAPTSSKNKTPKKPVEPIIEFLSEQKPDVLAIYEVRSSVVFSHLMEKMPGYQFHVTEGPQMQEILVGVKKSFTAIVTQKLEFKSGQSSLRPGVLCTLLIDGEYYPLLFLHLKSMPDPKGFGLRDDMIQRAGDFRTVLNKASANGKANYIFLGDLNTMGLDYPYKDNDISSEAEIKELKRRLKYRDMRVLEKTSSDTFRKPSPSKLISDLDHVVAADHLQFKKFNGKEVDVRGWPKLSTSQEKDQWNKEYSDHGCLYFEVQKV